MKVQDFSNIYINNVGYQCPSCNFKFSEINYEDFCDCGRSYYSGYSPAILLSNAYYKKKSKYDIDNNYNYLTITIFFIEKKTIIKYRYENDSNNYFKINEILSPEEVLNFNLDNLISFI